MPQMLHVSEAAVEEIREYASSVGMDPDVMAEEALTAGLATLRRLRFFEPENMDTDASDALEILSRGGDETPIPGDELPEGYIPFEQRRRA
jgi:hypothetical protein